MDNLSHHRYLHTLRKIQINVTIVSLFGALARNLSVDDSSSNNLFRDIGMEKREFRNETISLSSDDSNYSYMTKIN